MALGPTLYNLRGSEEPSGEGIQTCAFRMSLSSNCQVKTISVIAIALIRVSSTERM